MTPKAPSCWEARPRARPRRPAGPRSARQYKRKPGQNGRASFLSPARACELDLVVSLERRAGADHATQGGEEHAEHATYEGPDRGIANRLRGHSDVRTGDVSRPGRIIHDALGTLSGVN